MKNVIKQLIITFIIVITTIQLNGFYTTNAYRILSDEVNDAYVKQGLTEDNPYVLIFSRCQNEFFKSMQYISDNKESDLDELKRKTELNETEIAMLEAIKGFDVVNIEFILKLNKMLKTTEPSSSLINKILREYRTYEKSVIHEFNKMIPLSNKVSILENQRMYNVCTEDRDKALDNTKQYMLNLIKQNAAKKKSARLIEKMKQINDKMQGYDGKITSFYKMMTTLKSKLPGFVSTCITS